MFNRRHLAGLVLVSTVFAVAACNEPTPTSTGVDRGGRDARTEARTLQVVIDNRSPWDLSVYLESIDAEVALGTVRSGSGESFAVVRDALGAEASLARVRADGPHGIAYSDYRPTSGRIWIVFGPEGQVLPDEGCEEDREWREICHF